MNWLRRVFGSATSREREQKAIEVSQLTMDTKRAVARAAALKADPQTERLAAAVRKTVRAVRGGG